MEFSKELVEKEVENTLMATLHEEAINKEPSIHPTLSVFSIAN